MLQHLCELGQSQLMRTEYLAAIRTLVEAERVADEAQDWDTLARLYMPLQEARRQRRIRCGEGAVCLDLVARGPDDRPDPADVIRRFSHGQLLVAGWGTVEPAARVRALAASHDLYVETFLAATYPVGGARAVVIVPHEDTALPPAGPRATVDELLGRLPPHCIVLHEHELPPGPRAGTPETYARVTALWERLHAPYLAAADQTPDPPARIAAYRRTIRVDDACELAHQNLARTARDLDRRRARAAGGG